MKKLLSFVLVMAMLLALAGCGDPDGGKTETTEPKAAPETTEAQKETEEETEAPQTTAAVEETNPQPVNLEFPKLAAGAAVPEGCIYKTADGKTLNPGDAMPAEVQEKDEFITPQFIYRGYMCHVTVQGIEMKLGWMAWLNEENVNRADVTEISETMYEEINGLPLLSTKGTFRECGSLKKAPAIPNTVLDMSGTFVNCHSLQFVPNFPENLDNFGAAFAGCSALKKVPDMPAKVVFMDKAFLNCTSLEKTPDFSHCTEFQQFNNVFEGCTALKEVCEIPNCITVMNDTFKGCSSLSGTITIHANISDSDTCKDIFAGCSNLTLTGNCPAEGLESMAKTGTNIKVA